MRLEKAGELIRPLEELDELLRALEGIKRLTQSLCGLQEIPAGIWTSSRVWESSVRFLISCYLDASKLNSQ